MEKGTLREKWKESRWIVHACVLSSVPALEIREESGGLEWVRDPGEYGSDCEGTDFAPVRVFDLTSLPGPVVGLVSFSLTNS